MKHLKKNLLFIAIMAISSYTLTRKNNDSVTTSTQQSTEKSSIASLVSNCFDQKTKQVSPF